MSYEELCWAYSQPECPAAEAPRSPLFVEAQARAERERALAAGQAQFLVWLADQSQEEG
jgi:prolyl-tRNA editing enzyme YbaK/EbsC (Cys-tRNA(Pro) deacylase)